MSLSLTADLLQRCAHAADGPVALHLCQELLPVEGRGAPFFPPTFAGEERGKSKYNIDTLADGTRVALVDSVGAQANRMEPLFLEAAHADLVPQVQIRYGEAPHEAVSLLEAGHRLGDAIVRCTELAEEAHEAFVAVGRGDAGPMATLAPTSLVFGAWDSRDTGVKLPRIVQSVIRAWDVSRLTRSAQFVPALDYAELGLMAQEDELKSAEKTALGARGFAHVPSTADPGGIVAQGPIRRDVTINLVALRRLGGDRAEAMRSYLLGLALVAAGTPLDPFLRQGCLLVPDVDRPAGWTAVERDGTRAPVAWDQTTAVAYARSAAQSFGVAGPRTLTFDAARAREDMRKKK